ncbi:MAG: hypothetical protein K8J08_05685, partial [Thermoanaerobaculia bacterium]|nr:hypothetical protein [Thermoanaerobaculia bacterium]
WLDPGEQIFTGTPLTAGINTLSFSVPVNTVVVQKLMSRFRVSSGGGLSPTGPAGDGEVEDLWAASEVIAPEMQWVEYGPALGNPVIEECQSTPVAPSALILTFSEDLMADGGAHAANNPANYSVISPGANRAFDTTSSCAIAGDDQVVAIESVAYAQGTPNPSLSQTTLDFAPELPDGIYRLSACESIQDLAGNSLGGGLGAGRTFRVDQGNWIGHGHFDCDLTGWLFDPPTANIQHDVPDVATSFESGSAHFSSAGSEQLALGLCLSEPDVSMTSIPEYQFGGFLRVDQSLGVGVIWTETCTLFDQVDCLGNNLGAFSRGELIADSDGDFESLGIPVPVHAAAQSIFCEHRTEGSDPWDAYLDASFLRDESLFRDGFETGTTSAWSN